VPVSVTEPDCLRRFLFEELNIRGQLVHLDAAWREVLQRRTYPPPVRRLLGESMAAAALLTATVKLDGRLSLQIQSRGPLRSMVVQCSSELGLRGLARWDQIPEQPALASLCPDATLAITLAPERGNSYQGLVELGDDTLASALERYFAHSEQLPTMLVLAADRERAAGLLLQELPDVTRDDRDAWNRVGMLAATLEERELLSLNAETLLRRLFAEDDVRMFEPEPLSFRCGCSRERTAAVLAALGEEEIETLLRERGVVEISCDFCGHEFHFDPVDVAAIFAGAGSHGPGATRH